MLRSPCVALACAAVALSLPASASAFSFVRTDHPAGATPGAVAAQDIDRDGRIDLAVANNGQPGAVSLLMGQAVGGFGARRELPLGASAHDVVVTDVDRNYRSDIAVARSGGVSVLMGQPDGGFGDRRDYAIDNPMALVSDDFDDDGYPDVATANDANSVTILYFGENGQLRQREDLPAGAFQYSIAAGDVNGDQDPDLAVANIDANSISVYLGRPGPGFEPRRDLGAAGPIAVAVGDLDANGRNDIATANFGSAASASRFLGQGDGLFGPRQDFTAPGSAGARGVAVADFDGDARADIAIASSWSNTASVLRGRGDGTFEAAQQFAVGTYPVGVAARDLDADGDADLVVANDHSNDVTVLRNAAR